MTELWGLARAGPLCHYSAQRPCQTLELGTSQWPWRDADQVERALVQWVGWYDTERLHSALDYLPPEEFEAAYYRLLTTPTAA